MPWALQSLTISLQDRHAGQDDYQPGIPDRTRNGIQKDFKTVVNILNCKFKKFIWTKGLKDTQE